MTERAEGFYWVQYRGDLQVAQWTRCGSGGRAWYLPGYEQPFSDNVLFINENRILEP